MPLTKAGRKTKASFIEQYGKEEGTRRFSAYEASLRKKGKRTGLVKNRHK